MRRTTCQIDFRKDTVAWDKIPRLKSRLQKAADMTLAHLPSRLQFPIQVNLLLTTNAAIRRLNRDFRGMDKPTNVLSFPQIDPVILVRLKRQKHTIELGDITIAYQYIVVEAKNDHKILINHVTHLFIHGLLHLFGYDHRQDPEAARMERLETKIMAALDLPDPYAMAVAMEPKQDRRVAKRRSPTRRPKR
jgi:probable rRNA maturation factor